MKMKDLYEMAVRKPVKEGHPEIQHKIAKAKPAKGFMEVGKITTRYSKKGR